MASDKKIGRTEALGRGAYYGAWQQPRDVVAAALAAAMSGDLEFDEALDLAKTASLEGGQGEAQEQQPGWFGGGQVVGNIATTLGPAGLATKGIGATAPTLAKAPVVGDMAAALARGIGSGKGLIGVPAQGAVQGGISTTMTDGDADSGAIAGALGNSLIGVGGKIVKPIADDAISASKKGFTKVLEKAGINDLTPGQLTGSPSLKMMDTVLSRMPGSAGASRKKTEGQLQKFTKAALEKAGVQGDLATPDTLRKAEDMFNQKFGDIIKDTRVDVDADLQAVIADTLAKQMDKLPQNQKPIVMSYLKDIVQSQYGPAKGMTGEAYQLARSDMTKQARSMLQSDPYTAGVMRNLRNALDDAAERSLAKTKPERVGEWRQLRNQYANYKTIQDAANKVSNDSLEGYISPAALLQSAKRANPSRSQKGYGDLHDLAVAGRASITDSIPDSGTAQRELFQQLVTGGIFGAGTGLATGDPTAALAATGGTIALPKVAHSILNSKAAQTYFTKGVPGLNKIMETGAPTSVISAQTTKPDEPPSDDMFQAPEGFTEITDEEFQPPEGFTEITDEQQFQVPEGFTEIDPEDQMETVIENIENETVLPDVNSPFLDRVEMIESGGNPNAKATTSSASGSYQFTDPTWKSMVDKYGEKTGIKLEDKKSRNAQRVMADLLSQENGAYLSKKGFNPTDENLYLAHFLGAGGAGKVLAQPDLPAATLLPAAAKANRSMFYNGSRPRTGTELQQIIARKLANA